MESKDFLGQNFANLAFEPEFPISSDVPSGSYQLIVSVFSINYNQMIGS